MASLDKYSSISKQLSDLVTNYSKERDKKVAETKTQYGYDDRISNLENLKKTSLDTERIIRSLPTDINNRLTGRRMTSAQRNRVFAKEQAPLAQQLADVSLGVQTEQQGIDLVRNLINDVLGVSKEDFTNKYNLLNTDLGTAWNEYKLNTDLEEQQRNRDFQARQNELNRWSQERAASMNYEPLLKLIEDQKKETKINTALKNLHGAQYGTAATNAAIKALQNLGYDTGSIRVKNGTILTK